MNDNKYTKQEDTHNYFCPFRLGNNRTISCAGTHCMAWKWTAYQKNSKIMAVFSKLDKLYHDTLVTKKINTHGCCGMVYKEEIEIREFIPDV